MKLITAIVKPHTVSDVQAKLESLGVTGMTLTEVRGYGRQKGHTELYRGAEYQIDFLPKTKIEIVTLNNMEDQVVNAIIETARTGKIGDGKIFVSTIDRSIRIRTGEEDNESL